MTDGHDTYGAVIRERRRSLKWTQADLAERAGVDRSMISMIERGRGVVGNAQTIHSLAVALGLDGGDLLALAAAQASNTATVGAADA